VVEDGGSAERGARWHEEAGEVLWVDILAAKFHRGAIATDGGLELVASVAVDRPVGAVAPAVGGGYVLAAGTGFLFVDAAGPLSELAQPEAGRTDVRMNDGACDPQGRFWAGTMAYDESSGKGALYRLELDGSCTRVLAGLTIANGIGWSPDGATMYLADSGTGRVEAFDFDGSSGDISRRRILVRIELYASSRRGGSRRAHRRRGGGNLGCVVGGGAIERYAADGSLLTRVRLPVDRPTSCAFGGPDRTTLFVTTARAGLDEVALARQPHAGHVLRIDGLGVRGMPCMPYRVRIDAAALHG
jgi:sugar lactone lactonase YvrE